MTSDEDLRTTLSLTGVGHPSPPLNDPARTEAPNLKEFSKSEVEILERAAFKRGMLKAAEMVRNHWNTAADQKEQARRSASALEMAAEREEV